MINEKTLDYLEEKIPELAVLAMKQAYLQALVSGSSVLSVENNSLIEIFPDGSKKTIKILAPVIKVQQGQEWKLQ